MYAEDEMLMLSGIQHFMFCPRQWALIHIEQQWDENRLTMEGNLLHSNVDNPSYRQKNGETITLRSVSIASKTLGLYGVTDAIELLPAVNGEKGISHKVYPGLWKPYPVEYKRGRPKCSPVDEVQLAAQVMCLEEMYGIEIEQGALFYWETRHRETIHIDQNLRRQTIDCANQMHNLFKGGCIPKAVSSKRCTNCSLANVCMPNIEKCLTPNTYLNKFLYEETT